MLERAGKAAIPMLFFAGVPFLFAGPVIGIICWLLALALVMVFYVPRIRDWLGIQDRPPQGSPPRMIGGVRNHPGARSTHIRSRFKHGAGIENLPGNADQPGGESYDKESTFGSC